MDLELQKHYIVTSAFLGLIEERLTPSRPQQIAEHFVRIILLIQNY